MHQLGGPEVEEKDVNVTRTAEPHCFARLVAVPVMNGCETLCDAVVDERRLKHLLHHHTTEKKPHTPTATATPQGNATTDRERKFHSSWTDTSSSSSGKALPKSYPFLISIRTDRRHNTQKRTWVEALRKDRTCKPQELTKEGTH
ncbi:hypothetical protein E2C01_070703 [Portunus trituberculatus]|uniref:Uncharacterized protein n=1 Tax=Portunus trituberculatus TaxID=210409 RepID=A0A5B7I657_PORTR|nr:hypothetical protein [Portunus trituberculatus]